jgi:hypothetical protein
MVTGRVARRSSLRRPMPGDSKTRSLRSSLGAKSDAQSISDLAGLTARVRPSRAELSRAEPSESVDVRMRPTKPGERRPCHAQKRVCTHTRISAARAARGASVCPGGRVTLRRVTLRRVTLRRVTLRRVTLRRVTRWHGTRWGWSAARAVVGRGVGPICDAEGWGELGRAERPSK